MASHQLHLALGSHRGKARKENEDAVAYHYPDDFERLNSYGALFVLADGVGGLAHGAEVAQYATRRLIEIYYQEALRTPAEMLKASISQLNAEIYRQYHTRGATTLVALVIHQDEAIVAHVGDSRAYHGKANTLKLITQDHAAEVADTDGRMRRKLTRALGYRAQVEASVSIHAIQQHDCLLLVTDGATRYFDTVSMGKLLSPNPNDSVRRIIERSNAAGGLDNVSAIMVVVDANLPNEAGLETHLRQLDETKVIVEVPDDKPSSPGSHIQPLYLWLFVFFGFMLGMILLLQIPDSIQQASNINELVGRNIVFEASALTYQGYADLTAAFVLEPNQIYFVQDVLNQNDTWICLYDAQNEQSGWILAVDLPVYRLLN